MATDRACAAPNCTSERQPISLSLERWHCAKHEKEFRPLYKQYKKYERDQLAWFDDLPTLALDVPTLLKRYAALEKAYALRTQYRAQAFAQAYWDEGHRQYLSLLLRKQMEYLRLLEIAFATTTTIETEPENVESVPERRVQAQKPQRTRVHEIRQILTAEKLIDEETEVYLAHAQAYHQRRAQLITLITQRWAQLLPVYYTILPEALCLCWRLYSYPLGGARWPRCVPIHWYVDEDIFEPEGSEELLKRFYHQLLVGPIPFLPLWQFLVKHNVRCLYRAHIFFLCGKKCTYNEDDLMKVYQVTADAAAARRRTGPLRPLAIKFGFEHNGYSEVGYSLVQNVFEASAEEQIEALGLTGLDWPTRTLSGWQRVVEDMAHEAFAQRDVAKPEPDLVVRVPSGANHDQILKRMAAEIKRRGINIDRMGKDMHIGVEYT